MHEKEKKETIKEKEENTKTEIKNDNEIKKNDEKEEKKENLEKKVSEYYDQILRLKADFENYRKRVEKEKPELINWGKMELILKILPLYDILISANDHIKNIDLEKNPKEQINELIKGLNMIFKEFSKFFDNEEIRNIDVLNKPYDPMSCEILGVVDGNDENDGLVVEELQKGYMLGNKILRTAKVKIAKKKEESK